MSNNNSGGPHIPTPWPAPNIINHQPQPHPQGVAPGGQIPLPTPQNTGGVTAGPAYNPGPAVTRVNSTQDPRVIWEDGHVAIIYGKDFPANSGMGRSKTRSDIQKALATAIDDQLQTAPGAGSAHDFVKVKLAELLARPLTQPGMAPKVLPRLPVSPRDFVAVPPKVAQSGRYKGQIIPDFPHDCQLCGGKYYQGAVEAIHPTVDGKCPALSGKGVSARRR